MNQNDRSFKNQYSQSNSKCKRIAEMILWNQNKTGGLSLPHTDDVPQTSKIHHKPLLSCCRVGKINQEPEQMPERDARIQGEWIYDKNDTGAEEERTYLFI